jgi:hypothetical protein
MRTLLATVLLSIALCGAPLFAADRCTGFKWDVTRELALFDTPGVAIAAGKSDAEAPTIAPDHLYRVQLIPQSGAVFSVTPGRATSAAGAYAGVAALKLKTPGTYRVAVDAPLWIDVAESGKLASVTDFQGQQNCDGPHKIVAFELRGARRYVLQLSGSASASVRLTVTPVPVRTQ